MTKKLIREIEKTVRERGIPLLSIAGADSLNRKAPEGFRPMDYLPGARSMLILARPLPLSVFTVPDDRTYKFYIRSFTTYYNLMDAASNAIAMKLEQAGFPSLPIPSYSPLRFHGGEPRGLMSFKHAAEESGMGKIGRNTLLIHPEYGNVLRFGGVLTAMEWPAGAAAAMKDPCPAGCSLCEKACPAGALGDGAINKTACMTRCISHVLMPPRPVMSFLGAIMRRSARLSRLMELFTLNFFENYGINCMACLLACPHFPGRKKKRADH
jgi:epoxyqueuosine reductase